MTFESEAIHAPQNAAVEDDAVYFSTQDDADQLTAVSIRLPKKTIENFKIIAAYHKMQYQDLMRVALSRFAESEFKQIAIAAVNSQIEKERKSDKRKLRESAPPLAA